MTVRLFSWIKLQDQALKFMKPNASGIKNKQTKTKTPPCIVVILQQFLKERQFINKNVALKKQLLRDAYKVV